MKPPPPYKPKPPGPAGLQQTVENWIRAEHAFRLGTERERAYSDTTTDWFTAACETLRRAATGHADLAAAGKKLGCTAPKRKKRKRR
jgi:hypothetical protein